MGQSEIDARRRYQRLVGDWARTTEYLSERARDAVVMVYCEEQSVQQAAKFMQVHTTTIRQHLANAEVQYERYSKSFTPAALAKLIADGSADPATVEIARLLLPVRCSYAINNDGLIKTVLDLLAIDPKRLLKLPNFGVKSYANLRSALKPLYDVVPEPRLVEARMALDPKYQEREEQWRVEKLAAMERRKLQLEQEQKDLEAQIEFFRTQFEERRQTWIKDTMNPKALTERKY